MDERQAVRGSTRRWLGAAVAVALVVVGAFTLSRLLEGDHPAPAAASPDCVARTDAPSEISEQSATWVRFCPLAEEGAAQRLRHPSGVITGELAASVAASLWEAQVDRPVCLPEDQPTPGPTGLFRIELGLDDGRVAEIAGDTGCSTRDQVLFSMLETTLLMDAARAAGPPGPVPAPVTCPDRFTTTATNRDGTSAAQLVDSAEHPWQSTVPLLPLPAVAADVCVYTGPGKRRELVDQWQVGSPVAESIRSSATTELYAGAMTDCELDPGVRSYVVVLTDATGTARTLTVDPTQCSPISAAVGTPAVDTYLGLATQRLVRLVAASKP